MERKPPLRQNIELTDLLQNLSNAKDHKGHEYFFEQNDKYLESVKETIPKIEKALENLKNYFNPSAENQLNSIIGVDEAAELWNLSAGYIKNLCASGKIKAKKIGKTWVIDKEQPNPSKSS